MFKYISRAAQWSNPSRFGVPPCVRTRHSSSSSSSTAASAQEPKDDAESPTEHKETLRSPPAKKRGRPRKRPPTEPDADPSSASVLLPAGRNQHHNSLATFLQHAAASGLSPTSTVYVGTHYEYTVATSLRTLGFALERVGGASDLGIDLLGTWRPPSLDNAADAPPPLRTLVQCKAEAPKPNHVRELEGALLGAPVGWRGDGTVALLVGRAGATKGVRDALSRSIRGLGFAYVDAAGVVRQVLWNGRMGQRLAGVGVGIKYGGEEGQVVLTWEGRPWVPKLD